MECQRLHMSFLSPHHTPTSNPTQPDVLNYAPKHSHKPTYDNPAPPVTVDWVFKQTQSIQKPDLILHLQNKIIYNCMDDEEGVHMLIVRVCWSGLQHCRGKSFERVHSRCLTHCCPFSRFKEQLLSPLALQTHSLSHTHTQRCPRFTHTVQRCSECSLSCCYVLVGCELTHHINTLLLKKLYYTQTHKNLEYKK